MSNRSSIEHKAIQDSVEVLTVRHRESVERKPFVVGTFNTSVADRLGIPLDAPVVQQAIQDTFGINEARRTKRTRRTERTAKRRAAKYTSK